MYVVNLKERPERLQRFKRSFPWPHTVWEAVDGRGKDIVYDSNGMTIQGLTGGEAGCFLSHYGIWKDAVKRGYSRFLVFEDDADCDVRRLNDAINESWKYDVFYASTNYVHNPGTVGPKLTKGFEYVFGATAYVVTNKAAQRFIEDTLIPGDKPPLDLFISSPDRRLNQAALSKGVHACKPRGEQSDSVL